MHIIDCHANTSWVYGPCQTTSLDQFVSVIMSIFAKTSLVCVDLQNGLDHGFCMLTVPHDTETKYQDTGMDSHSHTLIVSVVITHLRPNFHGGWTECDPWYSVDNSGHAISPIRHTHGSAVLCFVVDIHGRGIPTGTCRNNNVIMTSKRRRHVVLTSSWRCYCVVCPLGWGLVCELKPWFIFYPSQCSSVCNTII